MQSLAQPTLLSSRAGGSVQTYRVDLPVEGRCERCHRRRFLNRYFVWEVEAGETGLGLFCSDTCFNREYGHPAA